jgi:thymidylate kinase
MGVKIEKIVKEIVKEIVMNKTYKNIKIAFEGVDGAGKSTISKMLYDNFSKIFDNKSSLMYDCIYQNFPTQKARERLKTFDSLLKTDTIILANLFLDDYCDFIEEVDVDYIIMDRSPLSTLVYQPTFDSSCRDYIYSQIQKIDNPDILFYLYITEEEVNRRLSLRTDKPKTQLDEYESIKLQRYIDLYDKEFETYPAKHLIKIDMTNKKQEQVFQIVLDTVRIINNTK